jgi:hypothetical protein
MNALYNYTLMAVRHGQNTYGAGWAMFPSKGGAKVGKIAGK